MKDFFRYIYNEVKDNRLHKDDALDIISQFQGDGHMTSKAIIHPVIHENISDIYEQKFNTLFSGNEFFLKSHIVKGKTLLPAVTYLEMARKALMLSTDHEDHLSIACNGSK